MRPRHLPLSLLLLSLFVGAATGCMASDPLMDDLYTKNVYPGITNTYDVGSVARQYDGGYFREVYLNGVLLVPGVGVEVDPVFAASPAAGITAPDIAGWNAHPGLTTAIHGVGAGAVVGTTLIQQLDSKTLNSSVGMGTWTASGTWKLPAMFFNGDITTDRWLSDESNTFLGVLVASAGNLSHTGGAEGYSNTAIGHHSMWGITTGSFNTALGAYALFNVTTGTRNVAVGVLAGNDLQTGTGNVFLGTQAGEDELGSDKLYVDNTSTATPLIYGDFSTDDLTIYGDLHISAGLIDMSQIAVEPSSTANRAGIYALDLAADECTIGFFTERAVEVALGVASTNKMGVRWNGRTYYLLAEASGFYSPLAGAIKPTIAEGLRAGLVFFNTDASTWEKCTSLSPETWVSIPGGTELDPVFGASAAHGIGGADISNWNSKLSSVTGTALDNVFPSSGLLRRTGIGTYTTDDSAYLTGNQSITWTASGDVSGNASGATSISPSLTVTGIRGKAITLATGFLNYTGSAWQFSSVMANPMTTLGDIVYENASPAPARLAGNLINSKYFLTSTASGGVAQAPAWGVLADADIPATLANKTLTTPTIATFYQAGGGGLITVPANASAQTLATLQASQTFASGSTWNGGLIAGQYGGTGVANTGKTITLGGNLTTSGAFASTFTMTGITGVTFPTTGTLATTDVTALSSLASIGTITTGVWNSGTQIGVLYGGTGLKTVAAGSILAANALNTFTAVTSTSGTLYLQNNTGTITWAAVSGGSNALLDGTSHTDTTAGAVARGDVITGQGATPKWTKLLKGSANQVLAMDATGTDVVWATPVGGSNPSWYGKFYAARGDCDPVIQTQHENMLAVAGPTPTGIGITVGRAVMFTPPANITVTHVRLFCVGATTSLYKFAIYPVGTGSAKTWDSGTRTTAANAWLDITTGTPASFALTAGTKYWWCVTAVATGTTAGFRSEAAPLGTNYWGANVAPLGGTSLGLPIYAQFAVTSPGVFPATLPAVAAAAYAAGTTGTVPFGYLDYGGAK